MKLSVVIPCYNAADTLAEQLQALSEQVWDESWEVILADNGSTDASAAIAERFRDRLPSLVVVDASAKRGRSYARNEGAKVARGANLTFVDADDVVAPGWLAALGAALETHTFVAPRHDFDHLNNVSVRGSRKNEQSGGLQHYVYPTFLPHAGGCGLSVRRALHEQLGGFDEEVFTLEDTDYCWRLQLAGHELHFAHDALIYIRFRTDARSIYRQAKSYGEFNVLLYKRYRDKGMPPLSWKHGLAGWAKVAKTLPHLADETTRPRWLWQFGWRYGRLLGSLKYHVLAL